MVYTLEKCNSATPIQHDQYEYVAIGIRDSGEGLATC